MKKTILLILTIMMIIPLSGCDIFKRDNMEDISIITTAYPIEYVTKRLYGKHSLISSIYPDGTITDAYKLTDKQLTDFSKSV